MASISCLLLLLLPLHSCVMVIRGRLLSDIISHKYQLARFDVWFTTTTPFVNMTFDSRQHSSARALVLATSVNSRRNKVAECEVHLAEPSFARATLSVLRTWTVCLLSLSFFLWFLFFLFFCIVRGIFLVDEALRVAPIVADDSDGRSCGLLLYHRAERRCDGGRRRRRRRRSRQRQGRGRMRKDGRVRYHENQIVCARRTCRTY